MNSKERRRIKALIRKNKKFRNNDQLGVRVKYEDGKCIANGEDIAKLMKTDMGWFHLYQLGEKGVTHIDVNTFPEILKECA